MRAHQTLHCLARNARFFLIKKKRENQALAVQPRGVRFAHIQHSKVRGQQRRVFFPGGPRHFRDQGFQLGGGVVSASAQDPGKVPAQPQPAVAVAM